MTAIINVGKSSYSRSELRPILLCYMVAFAMAAVCCFIDSTLAIKATSSHIVTSILRLVPSVANISNETSDPETSEIILLVQWLFVPIYLFIWFYFYPPWSLRMRRTIAVACQTLAEKKRAIGLAIGLLFFGAWLAGDFQIISFPTFYNGRYVFPVSEAVPQLKFIYTSRIALTIYAWFGSIAEAAITWMFFVLVLNARTYLSPQQPLIS